MYFPLDLAVVWLLLMSVIFKQLSAIFPPDATSFIKLLEQAQLSVSRGGHRGEGRKEGRLRSSTCQNLPEKAGETAKREGNETVVRGEIVPRFFAPLKRKFRRERG